MADSADTSQFARQRVYYCKPCKAKHSPPTGARCPRSGNGSENEVSEVDESLVQTRTNTQPEKPEPKRRGRKPKVRTRADNSGESRDTDKETQTAGASSHDAGMQLILKQLQSIREEAANARESDRQTTQKALDALARRIDAPVLSSEEEDSRPVRERRVQKVTGPALIIHTTHVRAPRNEITALHLYHLDCHGYISQLSKSVHDLVCKVNLFVDSRSIFLNNIKFDMIY